MRLRLALRVATLVLLSPALTGGAMFGVASRFHFQEVLP